MTERFKIFAIIVAAGVGSRMNGPKPKQYLEIGQNGETMLEVALDTFEKNPSIDEIFVAVSPKDKIAETFAFSRAHVLKTGGKTRRETVLKSLQAIEPYVSLGNTVVLVHDAARALVKKNDVDALIAATENVLAEGPASGTVLAMSVSDTVKRVDTNLELIEDIDRTGLVRIATPQAFLYEDLVTALNQCDSATDESSAIRATGGHVKIVRCGPENFKITEPNDLALAKTLLTAGTAPEHLRIGLGYDSHRLVAGRSLILGGISIPFEKGLDGHSDADVLIHAIIDSLLGAAHIGNIGILFPDKDPQYKNADSKGLLKEAVRRVKEKGFRINNIDSVIIAEAPKLNPHIDAMLETLAPIIGIDKKRLSIKPKTNEKMGPEGKGEGMSAQAIALLTQSNDKKNGRTQ